MINMLSDVNWKNLIVMQPTFPEMLAKFVLCHMQAENGIVAKRSQIMTKRELSLSS